MTRAGIDWLDELRLEPAPPFLGMGTHALRLDDWLIVDDDRDADVAYKRELIGAVRPVVFASVPGSERAAGELRDLVRTWLTEHGVSDLPPPVDDHPLVDAALLVQEDLAVLERIDGAWTITSGVVCFPTHWTIADKIGLPLAAVHGPVAHYADELREKVDRFHDRLAVDRPAWRRNWVVVPTAELHLPEYRKDREIVGRVDADGSPMWLRSERQTLRRLPTTDAIVFTIRVQRAPLGVLRDRPDLAAKMLRTAESWDDAKKGYTSTGGAFDGLTTWLGEVVRGSAKGG